MPLLETGEHAVACGLKGGDRERSPARHQLRQKRAVLQQVLYLGGKVETDAGEVSVKRVSNFARVPRSVEKVGVAECDVTRPCLDLLGDVGHHGLDGHDEEAPVIDGHDRTMAALVEAAAAGFDVARPNCDRFVAVPDSEGPVDVVGVVVERGKR